MKVKELSLTDKAIENRDWSDAYALEINDKRVLDVYDGEPEDNTLSRNFNDIYKITTLLKMAWEAGKAGEEFTVTQERVEEI